MVYSGEGAASVCIEFTHQEIGKGEDEEDVID